MSISNDFLASWSNLDEIDPSGGTRNSKFSVPKAPEIFEQYMFYHEELPFVGVLRQNLTNI